MQSKDYDDNLDFFFGDSESYPLLTADEEKAADAGKWAATGRVQALLARDAAARELLLAFCRSCAAGELDIADFSNRGAYFQLRRDVKDLLPDSAHSDALGMLLDALEKAASADAVTERLAALQLPATLTIALGIIRTRLDGGAFSDALADALARWVDAASAIISIPDRETTRELKRAIQAYLQCRNKLVLHNIRLVYKLARENQGRGIPVRDLVQEGTIGLMRAAEKFDFERGFRFSTYAYNWTNQHIQRVCEGSGSLIAYPTHVTQEINQLHRARQQSLEAGEPEPNTETLATETGMSQEKVEQLRRVTNFTVSLDQPMESEHEEGPGITLPDPDSKEAVIQAENASLRRLLSRQLDLLDERERMIVVGRWGLEGQTPRTLAQLADQMAVSRELVRQLEKSALRKLQQQGPLEDAYEELSA